MADQNHELEQRLNDLYQRSLKGDAEAFAQAAQLATNALKNVQQVKSKQADALRQRLEHFLQQLRKGGAADSLSGEKDSGDLQLEELHRRVLAGDPDAVDKAALTAFGVGELEMDGKKMKGRLGIVFQCCLLFIEEARGARRIHILARPGQLAKVETKGLLTKKIHLSIVNGPTVAFAINKKQSTVDEAKRLENLKSLWKGLGL